MRDEINPDFGREGMKKCVILPRILTKTKKMPAFYRIPVLRRYPVSLLITLLIVVVSLYPLSLPEVVRDVPFYDKWGHFLMYGVLTVVIWFEYNHRHRRPGSSAPGSQPAHSWWKLALAGILAPCLLGGVLEILQATATTTRSGEWMDFLADSVGVLLGVAVSVCTPRIFVRRSSRAGQW